MIFFTVFLIGLYAILIIDLVFGFEKISVFESAETKPEIAFSVIIPFRDEARNLPGLLKSLAETDYPATLFEVILVNDESSDDYQTVITSFEKELHIKLLQNPSGEGSPKKRAIETGIRTAKNNWIITTDADCIVPRQWFRLFDTFIQKNKPVFIAAPVLYKPRNRFVERFQQLDVLSLQGSTIGGFGIGKAFLCNGANVAYLKDAFYKVNGYEGNRNISGGDDIFLLEKMKNTFPDSVTYLKNKAARVLTYPEPDWSHLIRQRIRWASKTGSYQNRFGKIVGLTVFLTNSYLILLFFMALFHQISWPHFMLAFLVKFNVDFTLIYRTARFFNTPDSLKNFFSSSIVYPFFTLYVGMLSQLQSFDWKGRRFKK